MLPVKIFRGCLRTSLSNQFVRSVSITAHHRSPISAENIVTSKYEDTAIDGEHLFDCIWKDSTEQRADQVAMVNAETGEELTYGACLTHMRQLSAALHGQAGLRAGHVAAVMMPNCPEYPLAVGASTALGATVTPVNPGYTVPEVRRQLEASDTRTLFTTEAILEKAEEAMQGRQGGNIICLDAADHKSDTVLSYSKLMDEQRSIDFPFHPSFDPKEDVALLPFSSGTTGLPKGVMLTHENLCHAYRRIVHSFPHPTQSETHVALLPMFHAIGFNCVNTWLRDGKRIIFLGRNVTPLTFIEAVAKYKPLIIVVVPPLIGFMATHPQVTAEKLASVKEVHVGGAPVGKAIMAQFLKKVPGVRFKEGWGMTELSGALAYTGPGAKYGSSGHIYPSTEMKVIALDGSLKALGPDEKGEICVRGSQIMKGYLNNPEATAATMLQGGWLRTGDIGYFDKEENIYIVDRLKELIKVKGYQVPPAELENLLRSHPDIANAGVIGVPDDRMGEVPRAYIIKNPGSALTEAQVHEFVGREAADYKQLAGGIKFVEDLPKAPSGKVLKRELVAQFKSESKSP